MPIYSVSDAPRSTNINVACTSFSILDANDRMVASDGKYTVSPAGFIINPVGAQLYAQFAYTFNVTTYGINQGFSDYFDAGSYPGALILVQNTPGYPGSGTGPGGSGGWGGDGYGSGDGDGTGDGVSISSIELGNGGGGSGAGHSADCNRTFRPDEPGYGFTLVAETKLIELEGGSSRYRKDFIGSRPIIFAQFTLRKTQYDILVDLFTHNTTKSILVDLYLDKATELTTHKVHPVPGSLKTLSVKTLSFTVACSLEVLPLTINTDWPTL